MFEEPEYVTSQTDDIVISACPTLVEENRRAQEFLWGYYLRIENNSAKKFSCWAKLEYYRQFRQPFCDDSAGFKGELPELEPGECFEFSSMMPLNAADAVFTAAAKFRKPDRKQSRKLRFRLFRFQPGQKPRQR